MSAHKMFLVSPENLQKLSHKSQQPDSIASSAKTDLESKLYNLLHQPNIDPHDKVRRYNELLQRYLHLVRKTEKEDREIVLKMPEEKEEPTKAPVEAVAGNSSSIEEEIIHNIPARAKKNVEYILQKLRKSEAVHWGPTGEVVIKGNTIKGSHILDLMRGLSQPRSKNLPTGWESFLHVISDLNVPISSISNPNAKKQLEQLKHGYQTPSSVQIHGRTIPRKTPSGYTGSYDEMEIQATPLQRSDEDTPLFDSASRSRNNRRRSNRRSNRQSASPWLNFPR